MTCHIGSQWLVIYHNFFGFPLGVSRILDQTRPLLIVLEHGSPYSLASAEDSCQPSAVSHLRTTSLLDWCCKSQGYFLKSSCFERQTPLEVDFRAFWFPSGGILRHQSILAWASGSLFLFGFQRNLFFYCKVNQKSINPGLGLWIAIFFWIRVEKSIRNQSIQAWASGSFCLFGFEGKVNQKPINPGLGLWISRGQRRKVAGPATLPRSLLYLFRRCILSAENLRPLASNFKLETSTS